MDWLLLALVGFVAVLTPGPDILLIFRTTLQRGIRSGLLTLSGIATGHLIYLSLVGFGFAALWNLLWIQLGVFLLGGFYLLWVAYMIFQAPMSADFDSPVNHTGGYWGGLWINLSNPKAVLFFGVVLSPFIQKSNIWLQMGVLFIAMQLAFLSVIILTAQLKEKILNESILRWIDRIAAVLFLFFGVNLLLAGIELALTQLD